MDKNEWCPGGSVYVDLNTGSFMLQRRQDRPVCHDAKTRRFVEQGKLSRKALVELRLAYGKAREAGLGRQPCQLIVSNGGPEVLVIAGPAFSAAAPENEGCWSKEASTLHAKLFRLFGQKR